MRRFLIATMFLIVACSTEALAISIKNSGNGIARTAGREWQSGSLQNIPWQIWIGIVVVAIGYLVLRDLANSPDDPPEVEPAPQTVRSSESVPVPAQATDEGSKPPVSDHQE